jgi:hypothetical protein
MKDKCFIYYGNPCSACLSDPEVKSFEDAMRQVAVECPYAADRTQCSPPRFACVRVAGARMARAVIQFYTEASEETLALDREFFRRRGPLPGQGVEAYIDPERGFQRITDPEQAVQRVWEHARAVLGLQPGEHVRHQVGHYAPPEGDVPAALLRRIGEGPGAARTDKVVGTERPRPRSAAPQPASQ